MEISTAANNCDVCLICIYYMSKRDEGLMREEALESSYYCEDCGEQLPICRCYREEQARQVEASVKRAPKTTKKAGADGYSRISNEAYDRLHEQGAPSEAFHLLLDLLRNWNGKDAEFPLADKYAIRLRMPKDRFVMAIEALKKAQLLEMIVEEPTYRRGRLVNTRAKCLAGAGAAP
jgi:hypothetical protein